MNNNIKITFPDGNVKEFPSGTTGMQIAESISPRLAAVSLGIFVNEKPYDLATPITEDAAVAYFEAKGDWLKLELLEGLKGQPITFYEQGNFTDLCRGTHVPSTGKIKFAKLLSIAGAYWRGDEKRPMLTRLYGISFPTK